LKTSKYCCFYRINFCRFKFFQAQGNGAVELQVNPGSAKPIGALGESKDNNSGLA
jgi:hypothetical protein